MPGPAGPCPSSAQVWWAASVAWCSSLDRCPPSTWSRQSLLEAVSRTGAPTSVTRGSRFCGWSAGGWPCTAPCSTQTRWPPASSRYLGVSAAGLAGVPAKIQQQPASQPAQGLTLSLPQKLSDLVSRDARLSNLLREQWPERRRHHR